MNVIGLVKDFKLIYVLKDAHWAVHVLRPVYI